MLEIYLFGSPYIVLHNTPLKLARRKSRAVLYYLATETRPVHREKLLRLFWIDVPRPSALQVLRTTLHGLRSVLQPYIITQDDYVGLSVDVRVDVREFGTGLSEGKLVPELWEDLLKKYQGPFLEGFELPGSQAFDDWVLIEREHFQRQAVRALTKLSAWYEEQDDLEQAINKLIRALTLDPLQEDLQRECIRLQYLAGDRPGAIRRYDELRRLLDEEMGVPPMMETRALYDAILTDRLSGIVKAKKSTPQDHSLSSMPLRSRAKAPQENKLPFIGRKSETAAIRAGIQRNQLIMIEGEPGIGKTRFAEELLSSTPGYLLVSRAHELEQHLPYQPIITLLRRFFRTPEWETLQPAIKRELSPIWLNTVSRFVPEQEEELPPHSSLDVVRPGLIDGEEPRLWEGIYQFIRKLAGHQSINIFIDDLHWADSSTIGLLGFLIRQSYPRAVNFFVTVRPITVRSPVMTLALSLMKEGKILRISLSRLSADEISTIAANLGQNWPDEFVTWLQNYSEGNPFVISELLRPAWNDRLGSSEINYARLMDTKPVPDSVYNLVQARLSLLSEPARRVLDTGVAAGREFDFDVVARAAGLSETLALDALDELVAAGLLIPQEGFRFMFDHHLTMEVAFREVGGLRHCLLHRRIAEALESIHRDRLDKFSGLLAWHFQEGNDPARAAPYAYQAGRRAASMAAWSEAISFYDQALVGLDANERLPVYVALAEAYQRPGRFPQSTETYLKALQAAEGEWNTDQLNTLKLALARTLLPQARFGEAIELARQIIEQGIKYQSIGAELIWGTALSIEGADLDQARSHLLTALGNWEQFGSHDLFSLGQIKFELGSVSAQQGDLQQAVEYYQAALEAANQSESEEMYELRVLALNNLAYHLLLLGNPSALMVAEKGLQLADERGIIGLQAYLYSTVGEIILADGELDQAEKYFQAGLEIAERLENKERTAGLTANLGLVAAARNQNSLAIYRLSESLGLAETLGTEHLAAQIRLWLVPRLPENEARLRLSEVRLFAESSGRQRLLSEVENLEKKMAG